MQLTHYLTPQSIIVPLKGTTKQDAIHELVQALASSKKLSDVEALCTAIEERERSASTFLPMGVAVPHARVQNVNEVTMITGVSPTGILDDAGQAPITAHVFCLFFSPTEEKEFGKHLKLLARIAAVFSDPLVATDIAQMKTPEDIFARIQKRERKIDRE